MTQTQARYAVDWRSAGACTSADPDLFFPISLSGSGQEQVRQARDVCARCAVRATCLEFALSTGQTYGIWGGTTPEERTRLLRRRRLVYRSLARAS
jgi:WhiB family transcriptional regulator, redox-sensing transcriptional regulator